MEDGGWEYPLALFLLLLIPLPFYLKHQYRIRRDFSAVSILGDSLRPSFLKQYATEIMGGLFLLCGILSVANFQYSVVWERDILESRWIMIVQDLSGSMNRPAAESGMTLGDVALSGVRSFIAMRHPDDLIGLIAFSSYAQLLSPPTPDRNILKEKLDLLTRRKDSPVFRELSAGGATNASYAVWLALSAFLMMLPEEQQTPYGELEDMRRSLTGKADPEVRVPEKLRESGFGRGMAIVLFTDGRIEANQNSADIRKGLPNFVNVVRLLRKLDVKLYLIVIGTAVAPEVRAAIHDRRAGDPAGQIFYMPRQLDPEKIERVYRKISDLEKNRLLVKYDQKRKETRRFFLWVAAVLLTVGLLLESRRM